jgi:hypothetical protein
MQFLIVVLLAIVSVVSAGTIAAGFMDGVNATTAGTCSGNCPSNSTSLPETL